MRVILDFDYTLFNAKKLRRAIKEVFLRYGVGDELFEKTYEESRGTRRDWHPSIQLEILAKKHGIKKTKHIWAEIREVLEKCDVFLYEDTAPFLEKISKSHSLALVSYGEDSFQNSKIDGCAAIKKYFNKITITQNISKDKEAADFARGEPAVFIEDNPAALCAVKKIAPNVITVRMNREMGRYANEPSGSGVDYEISNFHDFKIPDKRNS